MLNFKIGSREFLKTGTATSFAFDLKENFVKLNPAMSIAILFDGKIWEFYQ